VLDLGLGEGAFVFAAYQHLLELGANPTDAQNQLYGAEVNQPTFSRFQKLAKSIQARFPNLHNASFFEISFPHVDVIVGNPPYVRRMYMEEVDHIRQSVVEKNTLIRERSLSRLTDMYIYFLMHALPFLKPGGRLAVITADSWLNTSYGVEFKEYLVQNFEIEHLISLDRRVFVEAQVKPVMILASKKESANINHHVDFVRVKNSLPINMLQQFLNKPHAKNTDVVHFKVKASTLDVDAPWGIHFKAPEVYQQLAEHRLMTPMANLAQTRIGLQTLAKDFFVLTPERAKAAHIEEKFLEPLAQSSKYFSGPTLEPDTLPGSYVFYCSKTHAELRGTHALKYILASGLHSALTTE
jgi:tRNA1(Val) A37 N6-methylase TrmN6